MPTVTTFSSASTQRHHLLRHQCPPSLPSPLPPRSGAHPHRRLLRLRVDLLYLTPPPRRPGKMKMEEDKEIDKVSKFKRICVFCGSSQGKKRSYQDAAIELGKELVLRKIDLVYGGGSVGLMGLVSQDVYNGGGHVIG